MAKREQKICDEIEWIDITNPSIAEVNELSEQYRLNHHIVRDCMEPEHLPKYEFVDDVHFLILRFYAHVFDKQIATIQDVTNKIALFFTDRFLITIHKSEAPFLEVIRKRFVATGKCTSVLQVLTKITWHALETFDDPADRLSEKVEFYETQIMLKRSAKDQTEALYFIKREASIVYKVLLLMQEPINHIKARPEEESEVKDVQDQHLKIQMLYSQLLEDVNNLMNLHISYTAQRTNDVVKVLTIFSVFFMPLTFVVGIYGMNFKYMPELEQKWGYPAVLLLMMTLTAIIYNWFKRKGWL